MLNKVLPNITHILNENKVDIMFAHQAGKIVLDGIVKNFTVAFTQIMIDLQPSFILNTFFIKR